MTSEMLANGGLRRSVCLLCLVGVACGCQLPERARTCRRVASALALPEPPKPHTSRPDELMRAAEEFDAAAKRLASVGTLPPELDTIAKGVQQALVVQARVTTAAAVARKASQPTEYAAARGRADQTRKLLLDFKGRFDKLCAR